MRILVIDDVRDIDTADYVARNAFDGMKQLAENGPWDLLMLDHDLATFDRDGKEITGYDILCWLEENPQYLPADLHILSANPVGRRKMEKAWESIMRHRKASGDPQE